MNSTFNVLSKIFVFLFNQNPQKKQASQAKKNIQWNYKYVKI